jgi:hypothetical protein
VIKSHLLCQLSYAPAWLELLGRTLSVPPNPSRSRASGALFYTRLMQFRTAPFRLLDLESTAPAVVCFIQPGLVRATRGFISLWHRKHLMKRNGRPNFWAAVNTLS